MAYPATAVANSFLDIARSENQLLTQMKLQKLVYFAHGWYLALHDRPLIREVIEAWAYGPVVPELYQELKHYGSGPITEHIIDFEPAKAGGFRIVTPHVGDSETERFLRRVWDVYGGFSAVQLSAMTHQPGTPWTAARQAHPGRRGVDISDDDLARYFKQLAEKNAPRRTS